MKKMIDDYIKKIDKIIKNPKDKDLEKVRKEHLDKILFFQHERLVHLLVTLFYALFLIAMIFLSNYNNLFVIIVFILLIFLIFYVKHYFYLENHVQYLYKQYDKIIDKMK